MLIRYGWPGAVVTVAVGLIVWFLVAPLFSPALLATIISIVGILITVVGAVELVACLMGGMRGPRV